MEGKETDQDDQGALTRVRRTTGIVLGVGVGLVVGIIFSVIGYVVGFILWFMWLAPGTTGDSAFSLSTVCAIPTALIIGFWCAVFSGGFIYWIMGSRKKKPDKKV